MPLQEFISALLLYFVLPLWVLAGFADYLCHRTADIEHTSGVTETLLHWILLGEIGLPLMAAVVFKINALLIGFMIFCLIAHQITTHFDLRLATRTRGVSPIEQQIHSLLEVLPLTALLLIAILHSSQALALFGLGAESLDLSLKFKPLPPWQCISIAGLTLVIFGVVPYAEEFWRDIAAAQTVKGASTS